MANLEKEKLGKKAQADEGSKLVKEWMSQKPLYTSNAEALKATSLQLESLAKKHSLTVDAFLTLAETSPKFHEDYLEGLSLARQISYFKK